MNLIGWMCCGISPICSAERFHHNSFFRCSDTRTAKRIHFAISVNYGGTGCRWRRCRHLKRVIRLCFSCRCRLRSHCYLGSVAGQLLVSQNKLFRKFRAIGADERPPLARGMVHRSSHLFADLVFSLSLLPLNWPIDQAAITQSSRRGAVCELSH